MTSNSPPDNTAADAARVMSPVMAEPDLVQVLSDGSKVKRRKPRMRACNERNAKGKICAGHLKRWYAPSAVAREALGSKVELYRCERCHTLYLPNPAESPRTRTLAW